MNNFTKRFYPLLTLAILSFFAFNNPVKTPLNDHLIAEEQFKKIDLSKGDQNVVLKAKKKHNWEFRLAVPELEEGKKRPLVIALHWAGEEDAFEEFSTCLIEPGLEDLDAFIISPNGAGITWDSRSNVEKVNNLVALALKHWSVDPERVIITGYSDGGTASIYFAHNYSHLYKALIPISSNFFLRNNTIIKMPIFVIHGADDEHFSVNEVYYYAEKAKAEGNDIEFFAINGMSHFTPCDYSEYLEKAVPWLKEKGWE